MSAYWASRGGIHFLPRPIQQTHVEIAMSLKRLRQSGGRLAKLHRKYKASACEVCGKGGELHVHHKNRNHLDDNPSNCLTVCQECHHVLHARVG